MSLKSLNQCAEGAYFFTFFCLTGRAIGKYSSCAKQSVRLLVANLFRAANDFAQCNSSSEAEGLECKPVVHPEMSCGSSTKVRSLLCRNPVPCVS
jgi:hypothetical protein